jgi:hypothetical protein
MAALLAMAVVSNPVRIFDHLIDWLTNRSTDIVSDPACRWAFSPAIGGGFADCALPR